MYDYTKIEDLPVSQDVLKYIFEKENIYLDGGHDGNSGEVTENRYLPGYLEPYKYKAEDRGLTFILFNNGKTQLSGSMHVYKNYGQHNYDDFNLLDAEFTLIEIAHKYKFDLGKAIFNNIEAAVNIKTQCKPKPIIDSFIMHKREGFDLKTGKNQYYRNCHAHSQFEIKAYDKGLQHELDYNLFRFELKFKTMEKLNAKGIYTLADLIKPGVREYFKEQLIQKFNDTLIGDIRTMTEVIDYPEYKNLSKDDQKVYIWGHTFENWDIYHPKDSKHPDYEKLRSRSKAKLVKFKNLLVRTGADQLKNEIRELIINKANELCYPLKTAQSERLRHDIKKEIASHPETQETAQSEPSYYTPSLDYTNGIKKEKCLVTEIDISKQKKGSKFISEKTILNLSFTDPETYQDLFNRYSSKNKTLSIEKQSYFIAHNIRNQYFRSLNKLKK